MIKFVALFLYMLGMLLLWAWWMGPDPVHFTGYDEPGYNNYYELMEGQNDDD